MCAITSRIIFTPWVPHIKTLRGAYPTAGGKRVVGPILRARIPTINILLLLIGSQVNKVCKCTYVALVSNGLEVHVDFTVWIECKLHWYRTIRIVAII